MQDFYHQPYGQWYYWQGSNDECILWSEGRRKGRKGQGLQDEEHGIDASIPEFPKLKGHPLLVYYLRYYVRVPYFGKEPVLCQTSPGLAVTWQALFFSFALTDVAVNTKVPSTSSY